MNHIFLKHGHYIPLISADAAGATCEFYNNDFHQFLRNDVPFKAKVKDDTFQIYESYDFDNQSTRFKVFPIQKSLDLLEKYEIVFFGIAAGTSELLTSQTILEKARLLVFDQTEKKFFAPEDGQYVDGNNLIAMLYLFRLNKNNSYALLLNAILNVDTIEPKTGNTESFELEDSKVIVSDNGNSIRSRLLNPEFTQNVKLMSFGHFLPVHNIFIRTNQDFSVKLFNKNEHFSPDEEFIKGFEIIVETQLEHQVIKDTIFFKTPAREMTTYLKIKLETTKLFKNITSGNYFENLELNYLVIIN